MLDSVPNTPCTCLMIQVIGIPHISLEYSSNKCVSSLSCGSEASCGIYGDIGTDTPFIPVHRVPPGPVARCYSCNKQKACKERKSKLERRYDTGGLCEADLVELEDKTLGQLLTDTVSQVVTV